MKRANADIREYANKYKVFMWEIAQVYGCNDGNFSRKLRVELPDREKDRIKKIITEIASTRSEEE